MPSRSSTGPAAAPGAGSACPLRRSCRPRSRTARRRRAAPSRPAATGGPAARREQGRSHGRRRRIPGGGRRPTVPGSRPHCRSCGNAVAPGVGGARPRRRVATGDAGACASPASPGGARDVPAPPGRGALARGQHGGGVEREGRARALGELVVDLAVPARCGRARRSHSCFPKMFSVWVKARTSSSISSTRASNSSSVRACASTVAAMAPAEVAVMIAGVIRSTPTRYCSTPTSNEPLVPPPARTNAVAPAWGLSGIRRFWHRPSVVLNGVTPQRPR